MFITQPHRSLLGLLSTLLVMGCATDDSKPEAANDAEQQERETNEGTETGDTETDGESKPDGGGPKPDAYADCTKGKLEADMTTSIELSGPGVDPETGKLEPGTYHVATTYLAIQPGKIDTVVELSGPMIQGSFELEGFIAMTIVGSESCNTLRTLTVWKDEQAMFAFVASPAHARAMAQTSNISRGTSNTITWDGDVDSVTWKEAARRLGLEQEGDL